MDSAKGKILRKNLHFHRIVEMKQPYTMTEPFKKASAISCDAAFFYCWMYGRMDERGRFR